MESQNGRMVWNGKVLPDADDFPMMSEDGLQELADDIKQNGQRLPIVLDRDGTLVDGRNRQRACEMAGIEPAYTTLPDGNDAEAYITSANTQRRNLTKSQEAIVNARRIERRVIDNSPSGSLEDVNIAAEARRYHTNKTYLGFALLVVQYAPDLVDAVRAGAMMLPDAYNQAKDRKAKATERKATEQSTARKLGRLQREAPDLHERVLTDALSLADALKQFSQRVLSQTPIHPDDANYPMGSDDEMQSLVASIERVGLLRPITYDKDGVLIDGKRRLVACALAGVEPEVIVLPDSMDECDIIDYICNENTLWNGNSWDADTWEAIAEKWQAAADKEAAEENPDAERTAEGAAKLREKAAKLGAAEKWDAGEEEAPLQAPAGLSAFIDQKMAELVQSGQLSAKKAEKNALAMKMLLS